MFRFIIIYKIMFGSISRKSLILLSLLFIHLSYALQIHPSHSTLIPSTLISAHQSTDQCAPGCSECNGSGECLSCHDPLSKIIDNKWCICEETYEKPGSTGVCEPCYITGCASCVNGENLICNKCYDKEATITDGICSCPQGKTFNKKGLCIPCSVKGCSKCEEGQSDSCQKCVDDLATVENGKCVCQQDQILNIFGYCSYCLVKGCAACTWSSVQCHQCLDSEATLVNGQCKCPKGKVLDEEGKCVSCEASNCQKCEDGKPSVCSQCSESFTVQNGACVCPEDKILNSGVCIDKVSCCVKYQNKECVQSNNQTTLVDGKCICHLPLQKPDQDGNCAICTEPGCESCCSDSTCCKCADSQATLIAGECKCPAGMKFDNNGMCTKCQVLGCDKCSASSDEVCEECHDCNAKLENGKCVCNSLTLKPNTNGICSFCFVPGCAQCRIEYNKCQHCLDPQATIDASGNCVCPENGEMKEDGMCLTKQTCLQDELIMEGKCEKCLDLIDGCQTCSSGEQCTKCVDPIATLKDGECYCPKGAFRKDGTCANCYDFMTEVDGQCKFCHSYLEGCFACDSQTECKRCADPAATLQNGQCHCHTGSYTPGDVSCHESQCTNLEFYDESTGKCENCSEKSSVANCLYCSTKDTCHICNLTYKLVNNECVKNIL